MCTLGNEIEQITIPREDAIVSYRNWTIKFNENILKSTRCNYTWPQNFASGRIDEIVNDIKLGIYSYNILPVFINYNNHNYHSHNFYNCNYHNFNNYYNYGNYSSYSITGKILSWGKIIKHELGYRSQFAKPILLVTKENVSTLDNKFLECFNNKIIEIARNYKCQTQNWDDFSKEN